MAVATLNELNRRADELKASGRTEEAIAVLRSCAALAPGSAIAMHNLAAALGDAGLAREGVEWSQRALQAGLDAPETWLVHARGLSAVGREDEALAAFGHALSRRPTDAVVHRDLAQLQWMRSGDRGHALQALDRALAQDPLAVEVRLVRAQVLGHTGDVQGELAETLQALRLGGGRHPMLRLAAANAALAAGAYGEALGHARAAAEAAPSDGNTVYALCRALLALGEARHAEAVAGWLRSRFPLDQAYIAAQVTAWRLQGDARWREWHDHDRLVQRFPLGCPPGWTAAERYVDDLVEALDRHHHYRTHPFGQSVRHGSQLPSIDRIDDPVLQAVGAAIEAPVRSYLSRIGRGQDPVCARNAGGHRLFSVWSVRLASSGYHVNHVHPQGWLSSACHLRVPAPADGEDRSGWLTFGEPGIPTQPALGAEHALRPERGMMVVFPSYLWHGTVPFTGPTTRLSIAADLVPLPHAG